MNQIASDAWCESAASVTNIMEDLRARERLDRGRSIVHTRLSSAVAALGREPLDAMGFSQLLDELRDGVEEARAASCPDRGAGMASLILWGADLESATLPSPAPLLGDGLLVRGGYSLLGGHKGTGKSWEALQLANDVARGQSHWGIPTRQGRVLVLSLELPADTVRRRLRAIAGGVHSNIGVIGLDSFARRKGQPTPPPLPKLIDPIHQETILRAVSLSRADLVIIDPIGRTVRGNENDELQAIAGFINDLAVQLDVAVFVPHHPRKGIAGSTARGNHHEMRGPSQLTDWAVSLFELREEKGRFVLGHPKGTGPRYCAPMEEVYLERTPDGPFIQVDQPASPEDRAADTRDRLRGLLDELGSASVSVLAERLKLSKQAVRDHLKAIGARKFGHGNAVIWKAGLCTDHTGPCDNLVAQPEMEF